MNRVMLSLGSNVAPRLSHLRRGYGALQSIGSIPAVAPLYQSEPYGVAQQPRFLNTALLLDTKLSPEKLLAAVKSIENQSGRQQRQRWGPRELDIDIVFYDRQVVQQTGLQIPHPQYQKRRFVLQPLCDLAPDFVPPDAAVNLQVLLKNCPDPAILQHLQTEWTVDGTEL